MRFIFALIYFSTLKCCFSYDCSENMKMGTFQLGGNPCTIYGKPSIKSYYKALYCGLQSKRLHKIPKNIINYANFRLILNNNQIQKIMKGDLNHLSNIVKICLEENKINKIQNESFQRLSSLKVISLRGNKIQRLHAGMWQGLSTLQYLSVDSNKIKVIERATFSSLKSLLHLSLKSNKIKEVREDMWEGLNN